MIQARVDRVLRTRLLPAIDTAQPLSNFYFPPPARAENKCSSYIVRKQIWITDQW